jgi:hypothetical protein
MWSAQAFAPRPVMPHSAAGPESGVVMPTTTSVSVTPRTSAALPMAGMVKMSATKIPINKNAFLIMTPFRKNKIHSDFKLQYNKKWMFVCQC